MELTKKHSKVLETFDKKLMVSGCKKDDLFELEKKLEVKLIAVDALGKPLWYSHLVSTLQRCASLFPVTTATPGLNFQPIHQQMD